VRVFDAGAVVPGAGERVGQPESACCHLAGEILNPLQECSAVRMTCNLTSTGWGVASMMWAAQ
jgi:hypothetical protein